MEFWKLVYYLGSCIGFTNGVILWVKTVFNWY
jgi:hypothetical protein